MDPMTAIQLLAICLISVWLALSVGLSLYYWIQYTHHVAISNQPILALDGEQVTFQYRNYRSADSQESRRMTISAQEFIRRFLLHPCHRAFNASGIAGCLPARNKKKNLALRHQVLHAYTDGRRPSIDQVQAAVDQLLEACA